MRRLLEMKKVIMFFVLGIFLTGGCYNAVPPQASRPPALPVISGFYTNPSTVTLGQPSNLMWNVTGATTVTISPDIGVVGPSGSLTILPGVSTTYAIIAANASGTQTSDTTVTVNPLVTPPVINTFSMTPPFVNPGQTASLVWNVAGADSVRIDPGIGLVPASGSQVISPRDTTTYVLTANNPSGIVNAAVTLSVASFPTFSTGSSEYPPYPIYPYWQAVSNQPVIVTFSVDPPIIAPGESTVIRWDVVGADSVNIWPGPGLVPSSGTSIVSPFNSMYYTLTATNNSGTSTAAATISVYPYTYYNYPAPNPIITVPFPGEDRNEALPATTPLVTTPSPTSQRATAPEVTGREAAPPPPRTSYGGSPEGGGGYIMEPGAWVPDNNATRVHTAGDNKILPRIVSFSSSPTLLSMGSSAQLRWAVNGATSVNISPDVGPVPLFGTVTVTPTHTTVYKITASNSDGVLQHTQEVIVPRMIQPPAK
jgi:hypothetical protein